MKFWIDLEAVPQNPTSTVILGTPQYAELQEPSSEGGAGISYTYVIAVEAGSFVVASCWGHEFDRLAPFIGDPKLGKDWVKSYSTAWPAFGELINNSLNSRFGSGALTNFEDPDDGERKWFVVSYVGNLSSTMTEWAEICNEPRIIAGCQLVFLRSTELLQQMAAQKPIPVTEKARMMFKSIFNSSVESLDTSLVWFDRISKFASLAQ